ncbi:FMN-binding negative transcriptional regulator [Craurococcus roseus]|uniref:FMN-binding negative transcriptional regulator n=1 Tax=Craurococcus roseus TaxID=77585 RepID=A0ABP3RIZ9_9PROT
MLYQPPAFREERPEVLRGLIRSARLAMLVSNGPDGVPDVTHLPLLLVEDGAGAFIIGHFARGNPHWRRLAEAGCAVAVFPGVEAYVSPNWYASKAEHGKVVPTWNYEAVHAEGPVEIVEDAERLHDFVSRLTEAHEAAQPRPWSVGDAPAPFVAGQLRGIVGVSLRVERLAGKRKLSQNRTPADRDGAIAGLGASADARDQDAASAMRAVAEGD